MAHLALLLHGSHQIAGIIYHDYQDNIMPSFSKYHDILRLEIQHYPSTNWSFKTGVREVEIASHRQRFF